MSTLILIPARAGSKGLPGKNIKQLSGKPLIAYSFEFAKSIACSEDYVCVSSNDDRVLELARTHDINVDFKRSEKLSNDHASMFDVLMDAITFYEGKGKLFEKLLLLQPTSPFRDESDYKALDKAYKSGCDMAVSVISAKENPYFTLFEESSKGNIVKSKPGLFARRQDCPKVYALNGSMYLINIASLKRQGSLAFEKIKMAEMPKDRSIDIDDINDFEYAQFLIMKHKNEDS